MLGSIIMDMVVPVPRFARPGETVLAGSPRRHPGGKGANQAVAAARLGAAASLIGTVGDDADGRAMMAAIAGEGVDIVGVAVDNAEPTGTAVVSVAPGGENSILASAAANLRLTPERVRACRGVIGAADVLLMQLEVPMGAVLEAARLAREAGTAVVLNAAPVPEAGSGGVGGVPAELLAMADVLIVNESEAVAMAGPAQDFDQRLAKLAGFGPRVVIATLGERGVRYSVDRGAVGAVEAFAVEAVDSTGAGDAFVAAFAVRWAEHQAAQALDAMGILDAVCWGAAAGALATRTTGAMPAMPRRGEVVGMLRRAGGG